MPPTTDGGDIAESYIRQELRQARSSLRLTQIASLALILLTAGYMGYMTWQVAQYSRPETAAEVANGIISERVDLYGQQAANSFKTQISQVHCSVARSGDCRRAGLAGELGRPSRKPARQLCPPALGGFGPKT